MWCNAAASIGEWLSLPGAGPQDLRGFCVLRQHYSPEQVAQFNRGIDELQAIPIDFDTYRSLGVASHALAAAMENQEHAFWKQGANSHDVDGAVLPDDQSTIREPVRRVDMGICGTALWDPIVTDPVLNAIHCELAGGPCFISATYYIEKQGPASGGGLHNGGFPKDKNIYYDYDHRSSTFSCSSTKSVTILSDMSQLAGGPFAAIPGTSLDSYIVELLMRRAHYRCCAAYTSVKQVHINRTFAARSTWATRPRTRWLFLCTPPRCDPTLPVGKPREPVTACADYAHPCARSSRET